MDTAAIRRSWPDVLARIFALKRATWTFLSEHAQVLDYDGDRLLLGISTVGLANTFRRGQHAEYVRQALIDTLGLDVRVEGIPTDEAQAAAAPRPASAPTRAPDRAPHPVAEEAPGRREPPSNRPPAAPDGGPEPASGPGRGRPAAAYPDEPPDDDVPPEEEAHRLVDDAAVSIDDEDVAELGEVGLPVVQRILGATVIDDEAP